MVQIVKTAKIITEFEDLKRGHVTVSCLITSSFCVFQELKISAENFIDPNKLILNISLKGNEKPLPESASGYATARNF